MFKGDTRETLEELGLVGYQIDTFSSDYYQLPITRWPCQSRAPVGAAPPTRSQLRLQRQTQA